MKLLMAIILIICALKFDLTSGLIFEAALRFIWPDGFIDTAKTAIRYGYNSERHFVTTEDNYILTVFRIWSKNNNSSIKSPVFLQHGLMFNSNNFVSTRNKSLALKLADLGYDVWLGNFRGTTYSKNHTSLSSNDKQFWDFSIDHTIKDLRAMLHFVANSTQTKKSIIYVGHSIGAFMMTGFALDYPDEAENLVKGTIFLAPVIYVRNSKQIKEFSTILLTVIEFCKITGINVLVRYEYLIRFLLTIFTKLFPDISRSLLMYIFSPSNGILHDEVALIWKKNFPTSTSINILLQLLQNYRVNRWQKFDYGKGRNLEIYKSEDPPVYNVSNYKLPTYIFYGENDAIIDSKDCLRFYNELGSEQKFISIVPAKDPQFAYGHLDFVISKDIDKFLIDDWIIPVIQEKFS